MGAVGDVNLGKVTSSHTEHEGDRHESGRKPAGCLSGREEATVWRRGGCVYGSYPWGVVWRKWGIEPRGAGFRLWISLGEKSRPVLRVRLYFVYIPMRLNPLTPFEPADYL